MMIPSFSRRMIARKGAVVLLAAGLALGLSTRAEAGQDAVAHDFVQKFGDQLVAVINSDESAAAKKAALTPLIQQNIDVDYIGQYCLGRYWKVATSSQREEFLRLFHQVMIRSVMERMVSDYKGVSFTIGRTSQFNDDQIVEGIISRPGNPAADVQLEVSMATGSPKVVDLKGEGASLRQTQRGDYVSYIAQHGGNVDALLGALRRQVSQIQ
jgi:phospholipid transport system substrate-binding protein